MIYIIIILILLAIIFRLVFLYRKAMHYNKRLFKQCLEVIDERDKLREKWEK